MTTKQSGESTAEQKANEQYITPALWYTQQGFQIVMTGKSWGRPEARLIMGFNLKSS